MIEFLSSWAQGIIVAVIIATLIEMILPNSSSKKYVKVVIGMYILFTIVSPIIKKVGGKDINLNTIDIEKYEQQISKSDNTISRKFEDNNTRSIKDIYVSNLKADISAKLKEKGLPWEIAKGFDGATVIGEFVDKDQFENLQNISFQTMKSISAVIAEIKSAFIAIVSGKGGE